MARAMHRVAARLVLAALGTSSALTALTACQATPAAAPAARPGTKARAVDRDPVSLPAPLRAEPHVVVRAHAAQPLGIAVGPGAFADAAGGLRVEAAMGGRYRSADGAVEVTIPPGALDRDAVVRFEALPTADLPAFPAYMPGVRVLSDLGGAAVRPGASIAVSARLDPTMVARLRTMAPGQDLAALGIAAAPGGGAMLTMPLRGPAVGEVPVPDAAPAVGAWSTVEFGGPTAAATPARRLMAEGAGGLKRIPAKMPTTLREFFDMEFAGVIGCDVTGICFHEAIAAHIFDQAPLDPADCGLVFAPPTPAPAATPTPGVGAAGTPPATTGAPVALPCRVTWISDDPRVDGQPVPGALVKFRLPGLAGIGPSEVLTDAQGRAATFAPPGWQAFPAAVKAPGVPFGADAAVVVRAGMPAVELQLQKRSPVIALRLVALDDVPLPDALTLDFMVGDRPGVLELPLAHEGAARGASSFTVQLDGDDPRPFTITAARLGDGRVPRALPRPIDVAWNGVYPALLEFEPEAVPQPK